MENANASRRLKQSVKKLDDILEEAKRENIIEINSRNQDRYRFKTTLETLTEEIAERQIDKRNVQSELLKKESILTKLKEKKENLE